MTAFEAFDHERHMERAIDLAREAADRGDNPFGSVLVRDDQQVAAASNRVVTESDMRRHPELDLAREAYHDCDADERARTVMYTSTEPCPMCAGGLRTAGLGRVVYSVGADDLRALTGGEKTVRAAEILAGITDVTGGVRQDEGLAVHEEFGW
ncbi:MAG: nucleoside deaminase [Halobacteriales archaeon]